MILSGRLADWSVADLLQILRITRKSASLRIQGPDRRGVLYFEHGMLVGADVDTVPRGTAGVDVLVEAVYLLQLLPEGSFDIGSEVVDHGSDGYDPIEILDRSRALVEAEGELRSTGLLDGGVLRLATGRDDPVTIEAAQWDVIAALLGDLEFAALEHMLGRPAAVAFAGHLQRRGLVAGAVPNGEGHRDATAPSAERFEGGGALVPDDGRIDGAIDGGIDEMAAVASPASSAPATAEVMTVVGHERVREMRSLITPAETTLVPGVLDDIRQRFRTLDEQSRE